MLSFLAWDELSRVLGHSRGHSNVGVWMFLEQDEQGSTSVVWELPAVVCGLCDDIMGCVWRHQKHQKIAGTVWRERGHDWDQWQSELA